MVSRHNIERLLGALFLTNRNFATFKCSLGHCNGRCSRDVYLSTSLYWYGLLCNNDKLNIRIGRSVYISAWASTLLVQLHWAMRRPRFVGRVTGRIPRFYFAVYYIIVLSCSLGFSVYFSRYERCAYKRLVHCYEAKVYSIINNLFC